MLNNHSIIAWVVNNSIKTENGDVYDFHDYMFMYDILRDWSPKLVCLKGAQIGFSTAMLLKSMWVAKNKNMDGIYILPTQADVTQFAGGKINRIIAQNPILQEWVKDKDTVEQKMVGDNIIYYRGSWTQKAAMMVSSDFNIYDEVDACNQSVLEQYSTRLQASDKQWEWYFSHPSLQDIGVDIYWKKSDQKHWFITCSCGFKQYLSFPDSFKEVDGTWQYVCKKCGEVITDEQRRKGEWVQKYKDRKFSGYWIPLFLSTKVSAEQIMEYKENKSAEYFYNKVLGLPYVDSRNKVKQHDIMKNVVAETPNYDERVVIGVDTGLSIHLVAGTRQGLFYHSSTSDYQDFERLFNMFPKSIAVFDAQGDLRKPRELAEKYPNRIFFCYYGHDRKSSDMVQWKQGNTVVADRNALIQSAIDEFVLGRIPLLGSEEDWLGFWEHWKNIYAEETETPLGTMKRVWKRSGDDHLVHALVYWRIGMSRFGTGKGEVVSRKPKEREPRTILPISDIEL